MDAISILGWKNEHELNYFPFSSPLVSDQGLEIPHGLFVDAQIAISGSPKITVKTITIASDSVAIELQVRDIGESYALVSRLNISQMGSNCSDILDSSGLSHGKFVFGRDASSIAKKTINKIYSFKKKEYSLEPSCILPLGSAHVTGIIHHGIRHRGAVALKEGNGVSIAAVKNSEEGTTTVSINAVGSSLNECCKDDYIPLKKINDKLPDAYGNTLIGTPDTTEPSLKDSVREAIKIIRLPNGIKLEVI